MLRWFLISFGVIIAIIAAFLGTLYYLIFVKDVALARPITYESEEGAVASGISDMLDGLLGIELTTAQETELEEIIAGFAAGTHELDDLMDFIADPDTGVWKTNPIHLTGQRSLELNETQLTALMNLILGSIDAFVDIEGLSSADNALIYTVEGLGDIKLSGFGININENDIQMVLKVTLPQNIPYVGFLFGGKSISIGLNPQMEVDEDGTIEFDVNPASLKIGGISASWPGVSYLTSYITDNFLSDDMLHISFNMTDPLNDALGSDLNLAFSVVEGEMAYRGPAPRSTTMRSIDYGTSTQQEVADAAKTKISSFTPGGTLELTETELTALMAESIEGTIGPDLGIDLDGFAVNVDGDGLSMVSTVTVPEGTELGIPAGSEIEIGLITEVIIDEGGNASLEIVGFDLGGLPDETLEELGLDADTLNDSLSDSGVDLAAALGLPDGSLTGASMGSGMLTLT